MFKNCTKKTIVSLLIFVTLLSLNMIFINTINAAAATESTKTQLMNSLSNAANSSGYSPESGEGSLILTIGKFVQIILSFLGIAFLILIIISGIQWMGAEGNPDSVKTAKARIKNATIGLAIVLLAYAITYFILGIFTKGGIPVLQ